MITRNVTPRQLANASTAGLLIVFALGILASIALVFGALWLLIQFVTLAMQSIVEALAALGTLYTVSDPMIRFLILCSVGYVFYRLIRHYWRKI